MTATNKFMLVLGLTEKAILIYNNINKQQQMQSCKMRINADKASDVLRF